jgi:methylated-DNA-[protein]-cysteine S-methyltransferase
MMKNLTMNIVGVGYLLTPVGFIKVKTIGNKVLSSHFVSVEDEKENLTDYTILTLQQIDEYFRGIRKEFDLNFDFKGSCFRQKVYNQLTKIPYGKTMSYGEVAISIGHAGASRAVGSANNKNTLFLIVPCHRVTTSSGKLSGARDWVIIQKWLLEFEKTV